MGAGQGAAMARQRGMPAAHALQRFCLPDQDAGLPSQQRHLPGRVRQHGGWRLLRFGLAKGMGQKQTRLPGWFSAERRRRVLRRELRIRGLPENGAVGHGEPRLAPVVVIGLLGPAVAPRLFAAISSESPEVILENDPFEFRVGALPLILERDVAHPRIALSALGQSCAGGRKDQKRRGCESQHVEPERMRKPFESRPSCIGGKLQAWPLKDSLTLSLRFVMCRQAAAKSGWGSFRRETCRGLLSGPSRASDGASLSANRRAALAGPPFRTMRERERRPRPPRAGICP